MNEQRNLVSHPESALHFSDDELIVLLYCRQETDPQAMVCLVCTERLQALQSNREQIEHDQLLTNDLSFNRMAAQRRQMYERMAGPHSSSLIELLRPKWLSAAATALFLFGSLFFYQQHQTVQQEDKISDVDLAQEVSRLSQSAEPMPAEPLKGLFE